MPVNAVNGNNLASSMGTMDVPPVAAAAGHQAFPTPSPTPKAALPPMSGGGPAPAADHVYEAFQKYQMTGKLPDDPEMAKQVLASIEDRSNGGALNKAAAGGEAIVKGSQGQGQ